MTPLYLIPLGFLDYVGIGVFALSGALVAAEKRQDFVTFVFFAVVAGVGGGTVRDLLIGAPVFWVRENWMLLICFCAALLVWFTPTRFWGGRSMVWADAVGIAVYATYGAAKALSYGVAPLPAIGMGVLTACLGGIVRDVLAGQPSILLKQEYYVSAAALFRRADGRFEHRPCPRAARRNARGCHRLCPARRGDGQQLVASDISAMSPGTDGSKRGVRQARGRHRRRWSR